MNNTSESVIKLISNDLTKSCKSLRENASNLKNVASYCEFMYDNSNDLETKSKVFNETKHYTNQAIASISDQIYTVSRQLLELLEDQSSIIENMNFKLEQLANTADMHIEKLSRRKIYEVCVEKPDKNYESIKYTRSSEEKLARQRRLPPINFSSLDNLGHGVSFETVDADLTPPLKTKTKSQECRSIASTSKILAQDKQIYPPPNVPLFFLNHQKLENNFKDSSNSTINKSSSMMSQIMYDTSSSTQKDNKNLRISTNLENIEYVSSDKIYYAPNDLQNQKSKSNEQSSDHISTANEEDYTDLIDDNHFKVYLPND